MKIHRYVKTTIIHTPTLITNPNNVLECIKNLSVGELTYNNNHINYMSNINFLVQEFRHCIKLPDNLFLVMHFLEIK